jgi:hypothetical protein
MNSVVHEVFLALLSGFIAACFLGPMTCAVLGGMLKRLFRGPVDPAIDRNFESAVANTRQ